VRLVSDTSQRDIDTALAMSLGMAEAASRLSLPVQGLSDIRYDEMLFHPVSDEQYGGIPGCRDAIWQSQVKQVRDRFRSVSPPSPDLAEPLRMLQELGGLAAAEMDPSISLNSNGVFDGAINFVKDAADVAFFTRAGGIDPPYLPGATVSQVYALQEWSNYQQSVLHVGNAHAARKGAVLMEKVIEALASKNDTVTIIVGHDLDMDDVATALGVRWKLPPPYQCRDAEYSPTPPGSAMHFSLDRDTDVVGMSFLYPVYLPGEGLPVNSTGVLDSTPLLFPHAGDAKITSDSEVTYLEGGPEALRQQMLTVLPNYPGAKKCYQAALAWQSGALTEPSSSYQMPILTTMHTPMVVASVALGSLCLMIGCLVLARHLKLHRAEVISAQEPAVEEDQTELEII
jgi:hypothetical protein